MLKKYSGQRSFTSIMKEAKRIYAEYQKQYPAVKGKVPYHETVLTRMI
jgi:hypothetical protein